MNRTKYDWLRPYIYRIIYFGAVFFLFVCGKWFISLVMIIAYFFKAVRYHVENFDLVLRSAIINSINYIRYKEYNNPDDYIGSIDSYCSHTRKVFGCGKTLSSVMLVRSLYRRFNGKKYYDSKCSNPHWVTWKVNVLSNLEIFDIPVIPLRNMQQLVDISKGDNDGIFWIIAIDEANAFFNSRFFKENFQNEEQMRTIVTCRHNNMHMMFTGQRFKRLDAMIRDMCDRVVECEHFALTNTVKHYIYSAYDLENCDNPKMVERIGLKYTYVFSDDYRSYDTKALVAEIAKKPSISRSELASRHAPGATGLENVRNLSRRGTKTLKRK